MATDENKDNPAATSSDYDAMIGYWSMVDAILGGVEELRRAHGNTSVPGPQVPYASINTLRKRTGFAFAQSPYLPAFENETIYDYGRRRATAPLTNIYKDISENLSSKPFSKTMQLEEGAGAEFKKLSEDIDGQGNNLHVFCSDAFKRAVDKGVHWILVDYTRVPAGATLQAERDLNARPYWVKIDADDLLAVYSMFVNGREEITHARIFEPLTEQDGWGERCTRRVRVFNRLAIRNAMGVVTGLEPATFELWEEQEDQQTKQKVWNRVDFGMISIQIIPLVACLTGKREGMTWKLQAPLHDIAHMQIEEFQQESGLKRAKEMTAFPMLAGNGVTLPKDSEGNDVVVPVGPAAVLTAPMNAGGQHGEWSWLEPEATSLTFLQTDLDKHRTEMRNLGKQPMATANLTVVTTANVSMKASSAIQAWALQFKDAIEQCLRITALWLKQSSAPGVMIHTDFAIELDEAQDQTSLLTMEKQGILSKEDTALEFKRRGKLRDDFDWKENKERLAKEAAESTLAPENEIDPRTGQPFEDGPGARKPNGSDADPPEPPPAVN